MSTLEVVRLARLALLLAFLLPIVTHAEIERTRNTGADGVQRNWWPRLSAVPGWEQDIEASIEENVNALVPIGRSFADAESVIFASAIEKRRVSKISSVAVLIQTELDTYRAATPKTAIREASPILTEDGQRLRLFQFSPAGGAGRWERVAFGEDGDYFVIFTLSTRDAESLGATAPVYESMLMRYRRQPGERLGQ